MPLRNVFCMMFWSIHNKWPGAGPFSYVDDLAQTTRGYEDGIMQTLGPAGVCMAKRLEQAGCVISSKSVLVASNARLGQKLVKVFVKNGIVMNQEKAQEILGWPAQLARDALLGWSSSVSLRHVRATSGYSILFARIRELPSCTALVHTLLLHMVIKWQG